MKILLKHEPLFCMFLVIIFCAFFRIDAAQAQFEINLKDLRQPRSPYDINLGELRRSSPKQIKSKQKQHSSAPSSQETSEAPDSSDETSAYVVQRGDTISLILTRYYGLSQTAAEHLIPRVIRMNNLRSARRLTIGQTLLFPLPSPEKTQREQPAEQKITTIDAKQAVSISSSQDTTAWQEIQIHEAPPCSLARELSEKLKLKSESLNIFIRENVVIHFNERKLIAICNATPHEIDSIERLLAHDNMQLLFFEENESPLRVTEAILEKMGLSLKQPDGETRKDHPPFVYLTPDGNNPGYVARITLLSAAERSEKMGVAEKTFALPEEKPDHGPEKTLSPSETSGETMQEPLEPE